MLRLTFPVKVLNEEKMLLKRNWVYLLKKYFKKWRSRGNEKQNRNRPSTLQTSNLKHIYKLDQNVQI